MKLIVGLGNPGEKYAGNRHNIGFMAVDEMARGYTFAPWKKRFQGYTAEGQIGLEKCILLKPSTFMNESGRAVGEAMRFYKLSLGDVIVIHDEIDLKPGAIRVKTGGGNAGHNGLKSISAHIGNDYMRVRLGIDHPGDKALVANYVLHDFAKADLEWLVPVLEGVARGMAKLVEGSEAAFLSEAARGRKPSAPAAKLNGSTPAPKVEAPAPALRIEGFPDAEAVTLATIAAAASRPIEPMPVPPIAVAATREESVGAVSASVREAVIEAVAEPEPAPEPQHVIEVIAEPEPAPAPAKRVIEAIAEPEPVIEPIHVPEPQPVPEPEPVGEPEPTPEPEPISEPEPVTEPEPAPEPEHAVAEPVFQSIQPVAAAEPAKPQPVTEAEPVRAVPETVVEEKPALAAAAKVEPAPVAEPLAKKADAPKAAAAKPQPAPKPKKKGNIFTRWFRTRVRGGTYS